MHSSWGFPIFSKNKNLEPPAPHTTPQNRIRTAKIGHIPTVREQGVYLFTNYQFCVRHPPHFLRTTGHH